LIIGRGIRLRNKNLDMLKSSRLRGVEAIQLHHSLVSEQMVRLAHKQGLRVVIWTANSPLSIKNAINCGADGIISDKITLLKEILKDK
jgi:glycerophosphoryl diester phosphodiesterase